MNIAQIEQNVQKITSRISKSSFIYDLLTAYGTPKAAVTRLKQGAYNLSKNEGEILWKRKVFFKEVKKGDLHHIIDAAKKDPVIKKQDPRFIVVTDYRTLLAIDTKTSASLDIEIEKTNKHFDFFLPWAGLEKVGVQLENPADVKAAEKMARLYDQIKSDNPRMASSDLHSLNVFLSRLLFCFFAEDTGIFEKAAFTTAIASHTAEDGSDLNSYLDRLFEVLNTKDRKKYPQFLQSFPYVNGGLLAKQHKAPRCSAKSRRLIVECGELDWSVINPDIFGSMIQAVAHPAQRGELGMHYTSVVNILKVIKPLFLDQLHEEFGSARGSISKLKKLLQRLYALKIFDPACGSGNFLIISYKELRKLEIDIFQELSSISGQENLNISGIHLSQFYGIEIDDFAHEIAMLSLWLVEHQMNLTFKATFGVASPPLPLRAGGNVIAANAISSDWQKVCPYSTGDEIYVLGNPPYIGSKNQEESHKKDVASVFGKVKGAGDLDYISCWIGKASEYIGGKNAEFAFVSTNSICQGEQVGILWPYVLADNLEIGFAHQSFKWTNSAKNKAGVTCVIVGVRNRNKKPKFIYSNQTLQRAENINAYLVDGENAYVSNSTKPLNGLPKMGIGNKPIDDGNYLFLENEKIEFLKKEPAAKSFFYQWFGSDEFLNGIKRWCLLVQRIPKRQLERMPLTQERIERVRAFRRKSKSQPTKKIADTPERFHVECFPDENYIVVPEVSSERREYIPVGYLSKNVLASSLLRVIHSSDPFVFGLISSKIHMVWVKAIAGRLETRFRYSNELCYNTFPVPTEITERQKQKVITHALNVISERERFSEIPIGDLYDPDKMPTELRSAHELLDSAVDSIYITRPFRSDEERLELLFSMYLSNSNSKEVNDAEHS